MSNVPACKDCVHYSGARGQGGGSPQCYHPETQTFDIVGGIQPVECRTARHAECGLRGALFQAHRRMDLFGRVLWISMAVALAAVMVRLFFPEFFS